MTRSECANLARFRSAEHPPSPRPAAGRAIALIFLTLAAPIGCRSPLGGPYTVDPVIDAAIERELATLSKDAPALRTPLVAGDVEETLASRRDELEAIGPATEAARTPISLGDDLTGSAQTLVRMDLATAIAAAARNNLGTQIAAMEPAINREDVIDAEAAFDVVLFGGYNHAKTDEPQTVPVLNGIPLGIPFRASDSDRFETGVRKRFRQGAEVTLSTDLTRTQNNAPGIALSPDPSYIMAGRLGVTQPLMRGFGRDVNTATIRLAGNAESRAMAELRTNLLSLTEETESAYWDLVLAWLNLEIRQWLVNVGEVVRRNLGDRLDFDTKPAEYSDAVARVEQRKGDVIRARRAIRGASDRLKVLINDPDLTIGSEAVLHPVGRFFDQPIKYDLREAIVTALERRPEIEQAILAIDDASIRELLANDARRPLLNLTAQVAYFGIDEDGDGAFENSLDDQFVDYILGLTFERQIANRGPDALYRKSRLQRAQSLLGYRQAVQAVVLDVKAALRDMITNYDLIQASRSFRVAQAENLRTLEAEEPLRGLTPEFLNLKFQRQEGLATARSLELLALANFDKSLAALYHAMGNGLEMHGIKVEVIDTRDASGDAQNR